MNGNSEPQTPATFRLVARIGTSVAVASFLGLILVLLLVSDNDAATYGEVVGAYGLARQNLGPAMAIFGLVAVTVAGVSAWLFSLYASFRIAGPLYRLSRNLERQIEHGPVAAVPIRAGDALQDEWKAFDASVAALRLQHVDLQLALLALERAPLPNCAGSARAPLEDADTKLREVEQRVRL